MREWVETHLPWYDSAAERLRDSRTKRVEQRSEDARGRAERVIAEYRKAEEAASTAGDRLVHEARK